MKYRVTTVIDKDNQLLKERLLRRATNNSMSATELCEDSKNLSFFFNSFTLAKSFFDEADALKIWHPGLIILRPVSVEK